MNFSDSLHRTGGFICNSQIKMKSRGVFYGDNPFSTSTQVLLLQVSVSSLCIAILQFLLAPFGQTAFTAQMIGGIILGPSVLGKHQAVSKNIFPESSIYFSQTFALFGCMIFLFLVGVKMDVYLVRKSGRRGAVIGFCNFFLPLIIVVGLAHNFRKTGTLDPIISNSLYAVAILMSMSSSHVITCLLTEIKILNSELGRLAISSSMISGLCSWAWALGSYVVFQGSSANHSNMLAMSASFIIMVIIVICFLRPIMDWMIEQTGEGKSIKESYVFSIFVMILGIALLGEIIGQHFLLGPILLGMFIPDGPPLGSALIEKLESYTSAILLPLFFVVNVSGANLSAIRSKNLMALAVIELGASAGKIVGAMLPAMYYKMPIDDALSLGLVMSAQGICEVIITARALTLGYIDDESYSIMIVCMIFFSGAIAPLVKMLYRPRKYQSQRRRTILHSRPDSELRLLACVYRENNTSALLNLLEVSNPSFESPVCFYIVHLVDLEGRSSSRLVAHRPGKRKSARATHSEHIINAFRLYQQQNKGTVIVNSFTSIAPYETIHQDVCELALDKRVAMVLVPFHKRLTIDTTEDPANTNIRAVNRNILENSPCSVGILVDRGTLPSNTLLFASRTLYRIGVLFVGGPDDREALAYAMRMAEHPNVSLTVVHFVDSSSKDQKYHHRGIDYELINEFRLANVGSKSLVFKEELVSDSLGIITVIQALENSYELVLVGRSHTNESTMFGGFTEWNEFPELGFLGDLLASSDSKCKASLLVVQQQPFADDGMLESSPFLEGDPYAVVDMGKAWPAS